jgi:hypothetical protein
VDWGRLIPHTSSSVNVRFKSGERCTHERAHACDYKHVVPIKNAGTPVLTDRCAYECQLFLWRRIFLWSVQQPIEIQLFIISFVSLSFASLSSFHLLRSYFYLVCLFSPLKQLIRLHFWSSDCSVLNTLQPVFVKIITAREQQHARTRPISVCNVCNILPGHGLSWGFLDFLQSPEECWDSALKLAITVPFYPLSDSLFIDYRPIRLCRPVVWAAIAVVR